LYCKFSLCRWSSFWGAAQISGLQIAETTIRENILSRITYLFLKQPLACLRDFEEEQLPRGNKPVPWPQRWFAKPSIEVNIQPDVYTYVFGPDKPAYLVDSFQSGTALYLPAPAGSTKARGKLIIIAQELLYGMEVQSAPSLSEEKPPPQKKP